MANKTPQNSLIPSKTHTFWRWALLLTLLLQPVAVFGADKPEASEKLRVMGFVLTEHDEKLSVLVLVMNQTKVSHTVVRDDLMQKGLTRIWLMRSDSTSGTLMGIAGYSHPPDATKLPSVRIDPGQVFGSIVELSKPAKFRMADFQDEEVKLRIGVQIRARAGDGPFGETSLQGKLRLMRDQ